jgi:hypothetical protein
MLMWFINEYGNCEGVKEDTESGSDEMKSSDNGFLAKDSQPHPPNGLSHVLLSHQNATSLTSIRPNYSPFSTTSSQAQVL